MRREKGGLPIRPSSSVALGVRVRQILDPNPRERESSEDSDSFMDTHFVHDPSPHTTMMSI
jgi:hypothetical protein